MQKGRKPPSKIGLKRLGSKNYIKRVKKKVSKK